MKALYAMYPDGHAAQRAVDGLRKAGVTDNDITVISAQPMEEFNFSHIGHKTYMWHIACAGGLVGLAAATGLAYITETFWPINTGGMPIVSWWPNLIIMFELTMLGAILAAVITLIVTAGLGRRRPVLYDPEVTDGKILVGVENPGAASIPDLQRALQIHPSVSLKTI
jgi:ActD protein